MRGSVVGFGKDTIMQYSQLLTPQSKKSKLRKFLEKSKYFFLDNWKRLWVIFLWIAIVTALFTWKVMQYRNRKSFKVMGYCLCVAKGTAETLKFNMALILLPVCRNTLTWLRSTRLGSIIPFDDNLEFHKASHCFDPLCSFTTFSMDGRWKRLKKNSSLIVDRAVLSLCLYVAVSFLALEFACQKILLSPRKGEGLS